MEQSNVISQIRSFNRFYTNVLGLLDQHILDSSYSLTEVRILLEISKADKCTANTLVNDLKVDRSYMSRIIKRLEKDELITRVQSGEDNRVNYITITEKGIHTLDELNRKSDEQILSLVRHLEPGEICRVLDAMKIIKYRMSQALYPVTIRSFKPCDIEYVISRHRVLYEKEYALSPVFGDYVDKGVNHFVQNYDKERECMLIPEIDGKPAGSIAIARADDGTAQLRYFLLEPSARGRGLGHKLVDMALDFCRDKGYKHVFLETISCLETARHIYASKGFKITKTHKNPSWGSDVLEERWDMDLQQK